MFSVAGPWRVTPFRETWNTDQDQLRQMLTPLYTTSIFAGVWGEVYWIFKVISNLSEWPRIG